MLTNRYAVEVRFGNDLIAAAIAGSALGQTVEHPGYPVNRTTVSILAETQFPTCEVFNCLSEGWHGAPISVKAEIPKKKQCL
jgi:hypothetical protein